MNITNLFSNWLAGWIKKREHKSELALVLSFGRIDGTTRGSGAGTRHWFAYLNSESRGWQNKQRWINTGETRSNTEWGADRPLSNKNWSISEECWLDLMACNWQHEEQWRYRNWIKPQLTNKNTPWYQSNWNGDEGYPWFLKKKTIVSAKRTKTDGIMKSAAINMSKPKFTKTRGDQYPATPSHLPHD
jgi:hypothetical protein